MKERRGIFFDLDGTLIDLNPEPLELEQLRNLVLRIASNAGISPKTRSIFGTYQQMLIGHGAYSNSASSMRKAMDLCEIRWAKARSVVKYRGSSIQDLRRDGCVLAIVTNNGIDCLRVLFDTAKLNEEWFDVIVTRDDVSLLKPSPAPLELAVYRARQKFLELRKVWFLGDSENDERAAHASSFAADFEFKFIRIGENFSKQGVSSDYATVNHFLDDFLCRKQISA